jgi:hypothetical protein
MTGKTKVHWDTPEDGEQPYEAESIDAVRWNGFAVPRFREEVARRIVADVAKQNEELLAKGADRHDLDVLEITNEDPLTIRHTVYDGEEYETLTADADGLFSIGGWCWTWMEVDDEGVRG